MEPFQPSQEDEYPYWRRNALVMAGATFLVTGGFQVIIPFFPLALREYGATGHLETWVGYAQGSYFTLSFFLMPLWGVVADHYGRKLMALRTSLGMAAIFALLPLMPSLGWFLALYFLMGTTNGFMPATSALIATNTPRKSMGRSLTLGQTGGLVGGTMGPAAGVALASLLPGYRHLFWVAAGLIFAAGMLTMVFARETHVRPDTPFRLHLIRDLAVIRRLPNIRVLMFIAFINNFNFLGGLIIVSVLMMELLEAGGIVAGAGVDTWVGAATVALTIASALAVPVWGRLMDRHGPGRILAIALLAGAVAALPTALAQTPMQLVLARIAMGIGAIGIGPAVIAMTRFAAPAGMESRVLSYSAAFGALGIGAGPFVAGLIGPVLGLRAFFALNSLLLLLGFAVWLRALLRGARGAPGLEG